MWASRGRGFWVERTAGAKALRWECVWSAQEWQTAHRNWSQVNDYGKEGMRSEKWQVYNDLVNGVKELAFYSN